MNELQKISMVYFSTPPTNFENGYYDKNEWFNSIIDSCHDMEANDVLHVYNFGDNKDLVLDIYKDEDYKGGEEWDMVVVSTWRKGIPVDDTEDIYVTDGSLYKELERIWNYKGFATK